jgi:hypothetical protein
MSSEGETKSKDIAREGWSVLPVVIGDSRDVDSSSLGESAFFLSERGILLLKEVANQGFASGLDSPNSATAIW